MINKPNNVEAVSMIGNNQTLDIEPELIKLFVEHLNEISQNHGVEAFNFFIDPADSKKINGRIFYNVDDARSNQAAGKKPTISLNVPPVSTQLEQNIYKLLQGDCFKKGLKFEHYFNEVEKIFLQQEDFKKLIDEFEKKYPSKGDALKAFIISQAAYTIYEKVAKKTHDNDPIVKDRITIQDEIKLLDQHIKDHQTNLKKPDISSKTKKQLNLELGNLKKERANKTAKLNKLDTVYENKGTTFQRNQTNARFLAKEYKISTAQKSDKEENKVKSTK